MAKTTTIGSGLTPVGYRNESQLQYYTAQGRQPIKKRNPRLRPGEIVSGVVIEIPSKNHAVVRLPNGTFRAILHGKLKRGDSLFFKVQQADETLILKVHSVNIRQAGEKLSDKEIIRVLDLPDSEIFKYMVAFLSTMKSRVFRDDALLIFNSFNKIRKLQETPMQQETIFRVLYWMTEAGIEHSPEIFKLLAPLFIKMDEFESRLKRFESISKQLPQQFRGQVNNCFSRIYSVKENISSRLKFFTKNPTDDHGRKTFYELLRNIVDTLNDNKYNEIKGLAGQLKSTCEAMHFWNAIALRDNEPLHLFLPLPRINGFMITRLTMQNLHAVRFPNQNVFKVALNPETPDACDLVTGDGSFAKEIKINVIGEKTDYKKQLEELATKLREALKTNNYALQSFIITGNDEVEQDLLPESVHIPPMKFEIVV